MNACIVQRLIYTHALPLKGSLARQHSRILKRPIGLNPGFEGIVCSLPTVLPGLTNGRDCAPRLAGCPVEEAPGAPVESFELASVFLHHGFPDGPLVFRPLYHVDFVVKSICLACSLVELGLGGLDEGP